MTTTTLFWEFASAALGIAMGLLASPGLPAAQNPPQAVVGVASVEVREITADTEFVGRVEAINSVDIRARVTGVIQDRPFQEGQLVRNGDLLYLIERAPYEAALAGAKAALAGAQATERNANRALQRAQQLARTGTATQVALEQAKTTYESAVANSGTADANLRQAQLNLDYTRITSPIDGRIGQAAYSIGSLVTPSSNPLARVVQVDPIRVVFSVSDRILLHLRQSQQKPTLEQLSAEFIPTLRLSTGTTYGSEGRIEFVGNEVDPQTGTIAVWTQFPNPDGLLVAGQFATVIVRRANPERRPVVPVGAVQQDREGKYVLLVGSDGKVAMRRIKTGQQVDQSTVVQEGLTGGEQLIVEGFQNARPGQVVKTVASSNPRLGPQALRGSEPP